MLLASAGMSSTMWDYQRIFLADNGIRAIGYDRRGHGRSDDPGTGYDYDTLAGDLTAVLEFHDVHDAVLVGHSMAGGEIVRYPNGVTPQIAAGLRERWKRDFAQWLVELAPPFIGAGLPGCAVSGALVQQGIADMLRTTLLAHLECNKTIVGTDFRAELTKVAVPTLILHGDSDASTPIEMSGHRQAELIPGSELIVYEKAATGYRDRLRRLTTAPVNTDAPAAVLVRPDGYVAWAGEADRVR